MQTSPASHLATTMFVHPSKNHVILREDRREDVFTLGPRVSDRFSCEGSAAGAGQADRTVQQ